MPEKRKRQGSSGEKRGIPSDLRARLTVIRGPDEGMVREVLRSITTIGRKGTDIIITDPTVSREHAQISFEEGNFVLRDMGSSAGTMLNSGSIWEGAIEDGDVLTMGSTRLRPHHPLRQTGSLDSLRFLRNTRRDYANTQETPYLLVVYYILSTGRITLGDKRRLYLLGNRPLLVARPLVYKRRGRRF